MTEVITRAEAPAPLGGNLLRARWRSGLTQEELSARSGVSVRTIGDIERGTVRRPHAASLLLLCDALGLTREEREAVLLSARHPWSRQRVT